MNDEQVMSVLHENMTHTRFERRDGENAYCFIANVMARAQECVDNDREDSENGGSWNPSNHRINR